MLALQVSILWQLINKFAFMSQNKVSIIHSSSEVVSCNGSISFSNHPTIYLNLKNKKEVVCPYCGIKYIYKDDSDAQVSSS